MEVSEREAAMLYELHEARDSYCQNSDMRAHLRAQHVHMTPIVGPGGVGKTTVAARVLEKEPFIHPIDTSTNRARKASDPPGFRTGLSIDELYRDIKKGIVVNYTVIKETNTIYATYNEGFTSLHSIGPVTADSIDTLLNSELMIDGPVYLLTPSRMFYNFIRLSAHDRHDRITDRIPEMIQSLSFAKNNLDLFKFVENRQGRDGLEKAADAVIAITLGYPYNVLSLADAEERLDDMMTVTEQVAV